MWHEVKVGQRWMVLDNGSAKRPFQVERIVYGGPEDRVFGRFTDTGREGSFTLRCLQRGLRSARLVCDADGSEPEKKPLEKVILSAEDKLTASDYRKEVRPRGMTTVSSRCNEAYELHTKQHLPVKEVAARLGVSSSRASSMIMSVKDKLVEQQWLKRAVGR
jgi:hypothetical protein